jgi:hypothetical protein
MNRLLPISAVLALTACSTIPAVTPSQPVQVNLAKAENVLEAAYSVAASAYVAAEPNMSPTVKSQAKAILSEVLTCPAVVTPAAPCTGYLQLARNAVAAGDAANLAEQATQIRALISDAASLVTPK